MKPDEYSELEREILTVYRSKAPRRQLGLLPDIVSTICRYRGLALSRRELSSFRRAVQEI